MLGEYLAKFHAGCRVITRVRLGPHLSPESDPTLTPEEQSLLGAAFRRWADAVCIDAGVLYVIETALMPDPRDVSLLLLYMDLIDVTPELAEVARLPRKAILVFAHGADPYTTALAVRHGIEVRIYKPSFFTEWLNIVRARERRPSRTGLLAPSA